MALTRPHAIRLDGDAERVRQSHQQAIVEWQQSAAAGLTIVATGLVVPGTTVNSAVSVSHGLGRAPRFVWISAPRVAPGDLGSLTAGMVLDLGTVDALGFPIERTKSIKIGAFGYTVDIIVDVAVA